MIQHWISLLLRPSELGSLGRPANVMRLGTKDALLFTMFVWLVRTILLNLQYLVIDKSSGVECLINIKMYCQLVVEQLQYASIWGRRFRIGPDPLHQRENVSGDL